MKFCNKQEGCQPRCQHIINHPFCLQGCEFRLKTDPDPTLETKTGAGTDRQEGDNPKKNNNLT